VTVWYDRPVRGHVVIALALAAIACRGGKGKLADDAAQLDSGIDPAEQAAAYDKQCVAGDLEACRQLGTAYLEGKGVLQDLPRSFALFVQACNGSSFAACNALALQYLEGIGTAKNPQRAVESYQKACDGGFKLACLRLGLVLRDGRGVPVDLVRAELLLDKACKGQVPFACMNAGDVDAVLATKPAGLAYAKQSIAHYKRGCETGDPTACRQLGLAYLDGRGVPKAAPTAVVWLQRACLPDEPRACRILGSLLVQGAPGVPRDLERGKQLLSRACDARDDEACKLLQLANEAAAGGSGDAGVQAPAIAPDGSASGPH
jgi:TPR repeat protein